MKPSKNMQTLVDCFAGAESHLAQAMADIGQVAACMDAVAREMNESGADIRAFELGHYHRTLGEIVQSVGRALGELEALHQSAYALGKDKGAPIPQPTSGGR